MPVPYSYVQNKEQPEFVKAATEIEMNFFWDCNVIFPPTDGDMLYT